MDNIPVVQITDDKSTIRFSPPPNKGEWKEYNLSFYYKESEKGFRVADMVAEDTRYRVVKERWYHRISDKVLLRLGMKKPANA